MVCLTMVTCTLMALISIAVGGSPSTGSPDLRAYTHYPGIGYFRILTSSSFNWTTTYKWCIEQESGGMLAVPNSEAEADLYKELIASVSPTYRNVVHIGFHDLFVNGRYETVHDTPLATSGYSMWALGAPEESYTLRCGGFSKDGGLVNLDCGLNSTDVAFICELPKWADYNLIPGVGHYKFHLDAKSWDEAWETCRSEDAHLAVINSMEEHAALQSIFTVNPLIPEADDQNYAWVGVHAKFSFNTIRTVMGTSLKESGYSTWESGHPAAGINRMYTDVALRRDNGSLLVYDPYSVLGFFCEHELL